MVSLIKVKNATFFLQNDQLIGSTDIYYFCLPLPGNTLGI